MRILVIHCHPCAESYGAALRDEACAALAEAGHEVDLLDLYAEGFDPVMREAERRAYHTPGENEAPVAGHLDRLRQAEGLIFVYPTWWYGPPAMLKGWLDRVWVPHATFGMPEKGRPIRPVLTHIRLIGAISTLGSPWWWWTFVMGAPGRRILLRGLKPLIARNAVSLWLALHEMDSTTLEQRQAFLARVRRKLMAIPADRR
jgi:putative NADPH-quinone reductase